MYLNTKTIKLTKLTLLPSIFSYLGTHSNHSLTEVTFHSEKTIKQSPFKIIPSKTIGKPLQGTSHSLVKGETKGHS